uniref:KH_dom_type_1 domain-containing protein n=1 Tax=Steinernema glaseri TaxID=37863 RepID=A0A1I8AFS1_9BILA
MIYLPACPDDTARNDSGITDRPAGPVHNGFGITGQSDREENGRRFSGNLIQKATCPRSPEFKKYLDVHTYLGPPRWPGPEITIELRAGPTQNDRKLRIGITGSEGK